MRPEIRERVTLLDSMVAIAVNGSTPDRRAWMTIEPDEDGRVVLVEIETRDDADPDAYVDPDDVVEVRRTPFASVDDAIAHLTRAGVDTDLFEAPWDTDYPL
jgi:hypothetical protein